MKSRQIVGLFCACAVWACGADVVTNTWITPEGGVWNAKDAEGLPVNWKDGAPAISTNIALFPLAVQGTIRSGTNVDVYAAGWVFRPAEGVSSPTNTWWVHQEWKSNVFRMRNLAELGYSPISVTDGALVMGDTMGWLWPSWEGAGTETRYRKEGNGTIRVSQFLAPGYVRRTFEVAEGRVIPMTREALAYTDVRETGTGEFLFTNYTSTVRLGSFQSTTGRVHPLVGNTLELGNSGTTALSDTIAGTGSVIAVGKNLVVTNLLPSITYGADSGRLRVDSVTGVAIPFAHYTFETDLVTDSSGRGHHLTGANQWVTRVYDSVRGGYVARFAADANNGSQLTVTATDTTELTGDSDYTVSVWAKVAETITNTCPMIFSIGTACFDHQIMQFRYTDNTCKTMLLGHWVGVGDKTGLTAPGDPTAWHHFVVRREGHRLSVWCDGTRTYNSLENGLEMAFPGTAQFNLGHLPTWTRFFTGDLDDVRVYGFALSDASVARLNAGEEPYAEGDAVAAGAAPALPEGRTFATHRNGEIQFAGNPVVSNIVGGALRGGVVMPAGGTFTMTGPGRYNAGIAGADRFRKTGSGRLTLGGALTYTGVTEVAEGTLALESPAIQLAPFANYDFETDLGTDASGNGFTLTPEGGVARVWDEARAGWVASFPGTGTQQLQATVSSTELTGDTDYTVSVWAKPASDCPAEGTFISLGRQSDFKQLVFRFKTISTGLMILSHWGTTLDFVDVQMPQGLTILNQWHHYVAVRKGTTYTVYCDGVPVWTTTKAQALQYETSKKICLGMQMEKTTRPFKGELDDVRIYSRALTAEQVARLAARDEPSVLARGEEPDAGAAFPAPVLQYSFEDASNLGRDSVGTNHLVKAGAGSFKQIDSPLGGKALKFDAYNQTYLKSTTFPVEIPATGMPFTVSLWVQTAGCDTRTSLAGNSKHTPTFICWGNPASTGATISYMLAYYHDPDRFGWTLRNYVRGKDGLNAQDLNFGFDGAQGLREGDARLRWHHYASVYDPSIGMRNYIDGELCAAAQGTGFTTDAVTDNVFYLGAKTTALGAPFRGALDEVKIFNVALTKRQVRALLCADRAAGARILPEGAAVTVAAGARLAVNGTSETWGTLTGAGTVDLVSGVACVTGVSTFAGTLAGTNGTLRLPAGAALTFTAAPTAFGGIFDMAGGTAVFPDGTADLGATFRTTSFDGAHAVAYPGNVEIPDGTALTLGTALTQPCVTADGAVTICGGGTVTLDNAKATGTWVLARGASVVDAGTGDLDSRWSVTNISGKRKAVFAVAADGSFICRVVGAGLTILIK